MVPPFAGHPGWVSCVAYSPDGRSLVVAGTGGAVSIWDAHSGTLRRRLLGHAASVVAMALSPDGSRLVTAGLDRTVRIWHAASGAEVLCLRYLDSVTGVAYSPDGAALAVSDAEGGVMLADASSGAVWRKVEHPGRESWLRDARLHDVVFSPDGTRIATAGDDGSARLWDVATGENTLTIYCHEHWMSRDDHDEIFAVAFSPDGLRLATSTFCAETRVWDARTGERQLSMPAGPGRGATDVAFSRDGSLLAAAIPRGARVWDASTGAQVLDMVADDVAAVAFSPDDSSLAVGGHGKVEVWRIRDGEPVLTVPQRGVAPRGLAFSPDGTRLASAGGRDPVVRLWDAHTGLEVATYPSIVDIEEQEVTRFVLSPSGGLVAGLGERTLRVWDAASGTQLWTHSSEASGQPPANVVAFSPDATRLATGHDRGLVRVWDARSGARDRVLSGAKAWIAAVAFSADGAEVVALDTDPVGHRARAVRVWNLRTGRGRTARRVEPAEKAVCLAPDGSRFARRAADGTIQIWDVRGDRVLTVADGGDTTPDDDGRQQPRWWPYGFSPDGARLAASDGWDIFAAPEGGWVRVWDTATGEVLLTVLCHAGRVADVAFSADNALFATAGAQDGTMRLWDGHTGVQLAGTDFE